MRFEALKLEYFFANAWIGLESTFAYDSCSPWCIDTSNTQVSTIPKFPHSCYFNDFELCELPASLASNEQKHLETPVRVVLEHQICTMTSTITRSSE